MILNPNYFAVYDFVLVIISLIILIHAFQKGFLRQLLGFISTILSFVGAWAFYDAASQAYPLVHLSSLIDDPLNKLLWFLLLLVGIRLVVGLFVFIFRASKPKKKMSPLSFLNHLAGLGLGIMEVSCVFFLWMAFCQMPFVTNGDTYIQHSVVIHTVNQWKDEVNRYVK